MNNSEFLKKPNIDTNNLSSKEIDIYEFHSDNSEDADDQRDKDFDINEYSSENSTDSLSSTGSLKSVNLGETDYIQRTEPRLQNKTSPTLQSEVIKVFLMAILLNISDYALS